MLRVLDITLFCIRFRISLPKEVNHRKVYLTGPLSRHIDYDVVLFNAVPGMLLL